MNNEVELLKRSNFRKVIDGKETDLFRLVNNVGTTIELTNYGARVVSIWTTDKKGNFDDIVLGCSSIDEYIEIKEPDITKNISTPSSPPGKIFPLLKLKSA